MMIANVSPAATNISDTLSTLRFAQRVKFIRNKVRSLEISGNKVTYLAVMGSRTGILFTIESYSRLERSLGLMFVVEVPSADNFTS